MDIDITQAETGMSLNSDAIHYGGRTLRHSCAPLTALRLVLIGAHDIEFMEFVPAQAVADASRTNLP